MKEKVYFISDLCGKLLMLSQLYQKHKKNISISSQIILCSYFDHIREFTKRMDATLPFYYYTINDRYKEEEPAFDERPVVDEESVEVRNHPLRLHRVRVNPREDISIFVSARAVFPPRHGKTIRQSFHKPADYLPDVNTS